MKTDNEPQSQVEEPLALLERELIAAYVAGAAQDRNELRQRNDENAREVLKSASLYASDRLAEVEARSHYVHALRGEM